jgi:methylthioribulose-1-phosphate dehydratase
MTTSAYEGGQSAGLQDQARRLCRTMAAIHRRGWCDGTGGNFSVVIRRHPHLELLMAPSGVDKGQVKPSDLIVVEDSGRVLSGTGKASAETRLHQTIVHSTGAGAVLHTHSQAATLLSLGAIQAASERPREEGQQGADGHEHDGRGDEAPPSPDSHSGVSHLVIEGLEMLKGLQGIQTHESQIRIPVLANDQDLDRLSATARPHLAGAPHGILIAGHGLYAWGADLQQAMRHLEILEFLLEQHWRQRLWNALVPQTR